MSICTNCGKRAAASAICSRCGEASEWVSEPGKLVWQQFGDDHYSGRYRVHCPAPDHALIWIDDEYITEKPSLAEAKAWCEADATPSRWPWIIGAVTLLSVAGVAWGIAMMTS